MRWLGRQLALVGRAVGAALLLTLLRLVLSALLESPLLAASIELSLGIMAVAALLISWRWGLSPALAWLAGYLVVWLGLLTYNLPVTMDVAARSSGSLVVLLCLGPLPLAAAAFVGSLVGRLFYVRRPPSVPGEPGTGQAIT